MREGLTIIGVLLGLAVIIANPATANQTSLAYVDMERLLQRAPQIVEGRAKLEEEFRLRGESIAEEEQRLEELRQRLRDEGDLMSEAQLRQLERRINALEIEIERSSETLQDEFSIRLNEEMVEVQEQMNSVIRELARERSIDMVVANPVLFASDRIDITDLVLERLEESYRDRRRSQ